MALIVHDLDIMLVYFVMTLESESEAGSVQCESETAAVCSYQFGF